MSDSHDLDLVGDLAVDEAIGNRPMSTRRNPPTSLHRRGDSRISSVLLETASTKRSPNPGRCSSYRAAASCSSASASGLKRSLLATEALPKAGEDFVSRDRIDLAGINVGDAAPKLLLPVLTQVVYVETG